MKLTAESTDTITNLDGVPMPHLWNIPELLRQHALLTRAVEEMAAMLLDIRATLARLDDPAAREWVRLIDDLETFGGTGPATPVVPADPANPDD